MEHLKNSTSQHQVATISDVGGFNIRPVDLKTFDDGPRVRDLDLAERLGFKRPRKIRDLIERNKHELERFGSLAPRWGKSRGQEFTEYWLNEEQALSISAASDAEHAAEVRHMLIKVFVAWRRGELAPVKVSDSVKMQIAREGRLQYRMFSGILKELGIKGNQAVLSANRATKLSTGFDVMGALGITHIEAEVNQSDLTPSTIAIRLKLSGAQEVNQKLCQYGYQVAHRDHKGRLYYELTAKGEQAGGVYKDTGKKTGKGTPIKQLLWGAGIIGLLHTDVMREGA